MATCGEGEFSCCPVRLARALFVEKCIDRQQLEAVCEIESADNQREDLMKILNLCSPLNSECTPGEIHKFRIFSTLLIRLGDSQRGKQLLELNNFKCAELQLRKSSSSQIYDCHNNMITEVSCCFQDQNASLDDIILATQHYEELHSEVKLVKSAPEAVMIIANRLSLLNLSYLEKMCKYFKLESALSLLERHHAELKCVEKMTIQDAADDNLALMPNYRQGLLISEEILIKMECSSENITCYDLKIILAHLFCQMSCHVMPYSVTASIFVSVRCYAPPYMHGVFSRLASDNKDNCATDVLSVSIGGTIIWDRKLENEIHFLRENSEILKQDILNKQERVNIEQKRVETLRVEVKMKEHDIKELKEENVSLKVDNEKPLSKDEQLLKKNMIAKLKLKNKELKEENLALKPNPLNLKLTKFMTAELDSAKRTVAELQDKLEKNHTENHPRPNYDCQDGNATLPNPVEECRPCYEHTTSIYTTAHSENMLGL